MGLNDGKPDGCTLEGMIWRANDILAKAASKDFNGIPKNVFEECVGVIIISTVQVGLMFTNTLGAGIALAKKEGGGWSLPCACSLSGLGFGFIIGGGFTDFIVFVMNENAMEKFLTGNATSPQQTAVAKFGKFDRNDAFDWDKETTGTVSVSFSNGAFIGASLDAADIFPRGYANRNFYNETLTAREIMFGSKVEMPKAKVTLIEEVYDKLDILEKGETAEPDDPSKVKLAEEEARKANEKAEKEDEDVVAVSSKNLEELVEKEKEETEKKAEAEVEAS